MFSRAFCVLGFRGYLFVYNDGMTSDNGPIISGLGVAASGLAMKAAPCMSVKTAFGEPQKSSSPLLGLAEGLRFFSGVNMVCAVATKLLATNIQVSAIPNGYLKGAFTSSSTTSVI